MSHGVRGRPWLDWRNKDSPGSVSHLLDCERCKASYSQESRQLMGCAWEPRVDGARPWWPSELDGDPDVCIGYMIQLPEVIEICRAFSHWDKGTLDHFIDHEPASASLLLGLEMLSGSVNQLNSFIMKPKAK